MKQFITGFAFLCSTIINASQSDSLNNRDSQSSRGTSTSIPWLPRSTESQEEFNRHRFLTSLDTVIYTAALDTSYWQTFRSDRSAPESAETLEILNQKK
jgi:hypothetical protein